MTLQNFTLDRSIFNRELYTRINDLWFADIANDASAGSVPALKKWFGMGSEAEKTAFDDQCSTVARKALDSISPQKLTLPPFESHEADEQIATSLSGPLLQEVKQAQEQSEKDGADTLLALTLLLDQMPRNLFRTQDTLPLVYNHYDRLSLALCKSSMWLSPVPSDYSGYALRPVKQQWYYLPLIHSESLSDHERWDKLYQDQRSRVVDAGYDGAVQYLKAGYDSEQKHVEAIRRFGRYPHRNECLGRETTPAEEEYLATAETFGVKQSKKKETTKDEL
ncbi:hypothetical protein AMS68_005176 [Peltaster fructicola]|uniref:DUF924-domain-containing protein n=1 Tax=Peltaster fructicola TaxID=286661 RepID=A0A6H0XYG1_9PEZI|nr:hypothetical protein AMS68_005176 [Peltaster fructicola]